ncbi:MAG: hypothetical protein JNM63_10875, partial [Spirochaetia bacterium]|nr:hypothetical protein [Spirochaetia bacterium]
YLDVVTNGLAQISNDTIALVKLYTNTNAGGSLGSPVASAVFDTASARLSLGSPIALSGTNVLTLYVGYDVGSSSNVIGKKLGLLITNGGIGFADSLADNFTQDAYASGLTSGPVPATNVQIYSFNSQPWDFTVIQSRNIAPIAIGVSNLYLMSYFDVMQDQESPDTQFLTNVEVLVQGTAPNVNGELRLYRDIGDLTAFDTNSDSLIATLPFSSSAGSQQITFSNGLLALYGVAIDPTRYYVALRITNTANAVFSNNVRLVVTNIRGIGPNGGLIQNGGLLYAVTNQVARVDDLKVFAFGDTNNLSFVNQGTIDNFAFKLVLSNADPDATNYLSSLVVSNSGTAFTNDLSIFKLYGDNGDGIFDKASDSLLANAGLNSNFQYSLSLIPYALGPGSNVFWGSYDVSLNATTNRSVLLRVVPGSFGFSDQFADSSFATYDQRPTLQSAGTFPATNTTSRITFANAQSYDFIVNAASYSLPASFTTNQLVNVGYVDLYQDLDIDPLALSNVQVRVTGVSPNALGLAYLYRTVAGAAFSTNELVGSTGVNGASFTIPITTSNLAVKTPTPPAATRFYLAYLLTNDIDLAKTNTIAFQITNFSVWRNSQ